MGSKTGLEAIEKTVIDRAVQMIYQPYFADPRPENMPVLGDLLDALMAQGIPEAERVAQALDLYVNGSLNFFNHRTTVDIRNRLVCFDIKGLGKNLKKPGMLIVQDAVWNTVTVNRSIGRATWYFVDEFHLLLKEEQTAAYSAEIWKRFSKVGRRPNRGDAEPEGPAFTAPEIENILENSDFIYLLNLVRWRPQADDGAAEHLRRAACLCDQRGPRQRPSVLPECDPALPGRVPEGYGAVQASHDQAQRGLPRRGKRIRKGWDKI